MEEDYGWSEEFEGGRGGALAWLGPGGSSQFKADCMVPVGREV